MASTRIKVNEATSLQLDWLVAKCEGRILRRNLGGGLEARGRTEEGDELPEQWDLWMPWHPTTDWAQGGLIIEREKLSLDMLCNPDEWRSTLMEGDFYDDEGEWIDGSMYEQTGPTPLVAAMRCFCRSRLGDEVEIPEELK